MGDAYGDHNRLCLPGALGPGFILPRAQPGTDVAERWSTECLPNVRVSAAGSGAGVLNAALLGKPETTH